MTETDAWNSFLASGKVVDYLQYKSLEAARKGANFLEENNENKDERSDNQRAEYR